MGRRVGMTPSELHVANLSLPGPPLIIRGKKKSKEFHSTRIPKARKTQVSAHLPKSVQCTDSRVCKILPTPAQTTKPNQQLLTETAVTPQLSPNSKRTIKTLKTTL